MFKEKQLFLVIPSTSNAVKSNPTEGEKIRKDNNDANKEDIFKEKQVLLMLPQNYNGGKSNQIAPMKLDDIKNDLSLLKDKQLFLMLPSTSNSESREIREKEAVKTGDENSRVMHKQKQLLLLLPSISNEKGTNQKINIKLNNNGNDTLLVSDELNCTSSVRQLSISDGEKSNEEKKFRVYKNNKENSASDSDLEDISDLIVINSNKKIKFENDSCKICRSKYERTDLLRKHIKEHHPGDFYNMYKSRNLPRNCFQCDECNKSFAYRYSLLRHKHRKHFYDLNLHTKKVICALCRMSVEKKSYISHCEIYHNIQIFSENLIFSTFEEFETWKNNTELDTKSRYVKQNSSYKMSSGTVTHYLCHRSGFFKAKGERVRHLKAQGSKKINGYCPSSIHVTEDEEKKYIVRYTKTHVGHENDIAHLFLTKSEKVEIATKLASNMPIEAIFDEIRDSVTETSLQRLHLLNRRDLSNIKRWINGYKMNSSCVEHKDDGFCVDTWIKEMKYTSKLCVLFYKPKGSEMPLLKKSDFILILMNEVQNEILKMFGSECICIDFIRRVDTSAFDLVTLLTVDNLRQCFPCAFLISNRQNKHIYELFFSTIKEKCGKLSPQVFMSDMTEACLNAWEFIMDVPIMRLYCPWHVDRTWRKNLKKIKIADKQLQTYKLLRTMLEEEDVGTFNSMLKNTVNVLENDPDCFDFATYFKTNYLEYVHNWANCYIINWGIDKNTNFENMHRALSYIYLDKNNKRLDRAIHAMMNFVRENLKLNVESKEKIEVQGVQQAHEASLTLSAIIMDSSNGWIVKLSEQEIYFVEKRKEHCMCNMDWKCETCEICLHSYNCSCVDFVINWNICKHIHLISRFDNKKHNDVEMQNVELKSQVEDYDNDDLNEYCLNNVLCERKKELLKKFQNFIDSAQSTDEIELLEKIIFSAKSILETLHKSNSAESSNSC